MLLPAPLWPMMPNVSPALDLEVDVPQRPEVLAPRSRAGSARSRSADRLGKELVADLVLAEAVLLAKPPAGPRCRTSQTSPRRSARCAEVEDPAASIDGAPRQEHTPARARSCRRMPNASRRSPATMGLSA